MEATPASAAPCWRPRCLVFAVAAWALTGLTAAVAMADPNGRDEPPPPHSDPPVDALAPIGDRPGFEWDLSWAAGLNYGIRRPLRLGEPGTMLRRLTGDEVALRGHIGGKLAVDGALFARTGNLPDVMDGVEVRRARIYTAGELRLGAPIAFKFELDFVQGANASSDKKGRLAINEAYLAWKDIPYAGTLYVGNLRTPVGLEGVTSARDLTFMELASASDAFAPGVKAGAMLERPVLDGRATWAAGIFANTLVADYGNRSDLASVIGRATFLPVHWSDGSSTTLLHLGLSQTLGFSSSGSGTARYRARPESHLAPFLVDTDDVPANRDALTGLELALAVGPLSLQGELYHSFVDARNGNLHFTGGYLYASYILTGRAALMTPRPASSLASGRAGTCRSGWEAAAPSRSRSATRTSTSAMARCAGGRATSS